MWLLRAVTIFQKATESSHWGLQIDFLSWFWDSDEKNCAHLVLKPSESAFSLHCTVVQL